MGLRTQLGGLECAPDQAKGGAPWGSCRSASNSSQASGAEKKGTKAQRSKMELSYRLPLVPGTQISKVPKIPNRVLRTSGYL